VRDDYKWSYIIRGPLGGVCAWGRGERDECVHYAIRNADDYAAMDLPAECETPEQEAQAISGPWVLVLWPPRFDQNPRAWIDLDEDDQPPPPDPVSA
jgi:hypothetical protein